MKFFRTTATALVVGSLVSACGDDGSSDGSTGDSTDTDPTTAPTTTVGTTVDPTTTTNPTTTTTTDAESSTGAESTTAVDTTGSESDSGSDSSTGDDPDGVQTEHGGLSLAEWMKLYWTWNLGGDQENREQDRLFLPLPAGTDDDMDMVFIGEIDVDLAAADGFVLPMFVWVGETYENGDPPDDDPTMPPEASFTGMDIVVTLDDEIIIDSSTDDLTTFYWDAIDFDETIVYPMPTDYGATGALWVKGVGFLHTPLAVGEHVLHLEEFNDDAMVGFSNTWNITVE